MLIHDRCIMAKTFVGHEGFNMYFAVLGPLRAHDGDREIPVRSPKQRALLAGLLLTAGRTQDADRLIDVLWDGEGAGTRRALQMQVVRLRQTVGDRIASRIVTRPGGYLIEVESDELDASRFIELCEHGRRSARRGDWEQATKLLRDSLDLWSGNPLQDVPSERLHAEHVPQLTEMRLVAIEVSIDARLGLGDHETLVGELRRLICLHPLRERFVAQLMLALYRSGRQADALAAYRDARQRLVDELGVEPGAELQALHQQILSGQGAGDPGLCIDPRRLDASQAACGALMQLPADIVDLTGRDTQIGLLCGIHDAPPDSARPGAVVISAVAGMGGIGKTALAVHIAHKLRDRYPEGQLFVDLRGTSNPLRPAEVLARFLRDLGISEAAIPVGEEERAVRYRALLAHRSMLIVLDDARDAAQVRPLLPGTVGCAVIVTSRRTLSDLPGAQVVGLDVLDNSEARSLFDAIVGPERAAAEPDATAKVLAICAGLPLAIRVAAARLASRPQWKVAHLAAKLAGEHARLSELTKGELAVRASFAVSYQALARESQGLARVFRLLGVPSGAALSLLGIAALVQRPADDVAVALEALADAHLVQSPAPDRFEMHELLHSYAHELAQQADSPDDRRAALSRLLSWYLHTADAAARVLAPHIQRIPLPPTEPDVRPVEFQTYDEAMEWCDTERVNLVAAVHQAACHGMHAYAWRLAFVLRRFFRLGKHWADWIATYQVAVTSAALDGNRAGLGLILNSFGEPYTDLGQLTTAIAHREKAAAIQHEIGDRQDEAITLANLGVNYGMLGHLEKSLSYLLRSLAIVREAGNRYYESVTLENIGDNMRRLGRYDEAISYLEQALAIYRDNDDGYNQGSALNVIGELHLDRRQYDSAARCYQQALRYCRSVQDRGGEASSLDGLGNALLRLGRPNAARRSWLEARRILVAIGDPRVGRVDASLSLLGERRPPS